MDVYVPWPISTLCMINVTRPSRSMRMKAFGANPSAAGLVTMSPRTGRGRLRLSSNPPPAAAPTLRNALRERSLAMLTRSLRPA